MVQTYPRVNLTQISFIADGEFLCFEGQFFRHLGKTYLQQHERKLPLIGEPFSWLPPNGMRVQVTGELVRRRQVALLLHDCRPVDAGREDGLSYTDYSDTRIGDEIILLAHTRNIGDTQIAVTSTGQSFVLVGKELDERKYALQGEVILLDPPTLVTTTAIPLLGVNLPQVHPLA